MAGTAAAQKPAAPAPAVPPPAAQPAAPPQGALVVDERNAQDTRRRLDEILRQYPPSVAQVLALDPTLLSSQSYLASYPVLAAFIAQQPAITRDPVFYLGSGFARLRGLDTPSPSRAVIQSVENLAIVLVFAIVAVLTAWVLRTLINYRRWHQVSRVQNDTHAKLLDRFTSNEDLLAYLQTPAGKRFLEAVPLPSEPPVTSAPLNRILWSIQAGIVFLALGAGFVFVSSRVIEEAQQPLFVLGVIGTALGAGFVVSALVSYALSRSLGLLQRQNSHA